MSSSPPGQTSTPSSNFKSILDAALNQALSGYKKKTGKTLLDHPLATELQRCDSVAAVLEVLRGQASAFQQFKAGDQRLMKLISPVVDVLYTFSGTLGGVAGLAFPPAGVIFTGIGVLLSVARDVRASHDALVELFERIESFFKRLGVYTQILLTTEMAGVLVKIMTEVLSILSIATKEVKRKRARIYFRRFLGRTDIEDALKRLDGLIQEEVRMAIAQTMNDAKNANDNIDKMKWDQIEQLVRKWFSPPDPSTNHNIACEIYHNVPPTWFFRAGVFKDWMSDGSLLWVHGKPGSGKSILCSAIIQHIMTLRDAGKATLAYFYFDFRDDEKQNVRDVVTSLLVQLSAYSKPCCDIIYRLYLAHGKGAQQPSNGVLTNCLKEMLTIAAQHPIFIVMDALDECPDDGMPSPREAVLNFVMDLIRLQIPNLHICATSRPEVDIQTILRPIAVHAISLHEETRQKIVISNYVSSVVSSDVRMMKWRDEDKKLVVERLSERADGMFQWVFCQLEMLRHAVQPDVRAILETLPKTLDETYERVLKDINKNNREHARRLLHCLAISIRPLRVEELAEILTFDFDTVTAREGIPKFHPDRRPKDREEAVLSICSSLVTVVNTRGSRVVQFSHLSVKEFLTSDHLASSTGNLTPYHILPGPAHTILAQVSLGFLLHLDDRNNKNGVKGSPLAEYAARHWVTHAQFEGVASRVEDGMKAFFDIDRPHFAAWIGLYDIDAESGGKSPSKIPTPLYYSALCGFHDLIRHIAIKHPQYVNAVGGSYGYPLVAALCRNHVSAAELLLEHGGNIDVQDTRKQTVLHKTIDRQGKAAIDAVQFLLKRGADVNARRDDLWTPLHLAVNTGELLVAQMLLDNGADVNSRNGVGQTPLHLLSRRVTSQDEDNCSQIAKLLLDRGANVNEKDKDHETPLHLAIYNKRLEIVRVLLNHGANEENDRGETPLQIVLKGNHNTQDSGVGIVRVLLEHGAEAYARDKYRICTSDLACCFRMDKIGQALGDGKILKLENNRDQTAFRLWVEECSVDRNGQDMYDAILLHSASYHGRPEMVRMLLNHGVKSDSKNHLGETALHVVSRGRYDAQDGVRVARLLLERGVDVNAQDKDHDSPLHSASYNGELEIARVLLDHAAKVSAKNDRGETPLHQVSQGEYESQVDGVRIAQMLLDRGVDVNTPDGNGATALHLTSWCGKLEVARLFLEQATLKNDSVRTPLHIGPEVRPVDVNAQQRDLETPLHFACFRGKPEIARLLLDHGANVNAKNNHRETPLYLVSRGEYDSPSDGVRVVELLLKRGADVNVQDKANWTPLHSASYNGKLEITQVLLHHGAKVDAKNDVGETALHLVRQGKYGSQDGLHVTQLLLDGGVDVNSRDKRGWTPLHAASYYGRLEIVQVLLDRGAVADAEDDQGKTPLHQVSRRNFEPQGDGARIAQLLLDRGVDVNARDRNRVTPLDLASWYGKLEVARLILEQATLKNDNVRTLLHASLKVHPVHVNAQQKDLETPLHLACFRVKPEIARLLLDHGAIVNSRNNQGETPLHLVSRGEYDSPSDGVRVVELLLKRGTGVNVQDKANWTPLHSASYNGKLEITQVLLHHGAKVDAKNDLGETALHLVQQGKYGSPAGVHVAQLLPDGGVDVDYQDKLKRTPLYAASHYGRIEIARVLLDHGAIANAEDGQGRTPLHRASQGNFVSQEDGARIAQLLLDRGVDVNAQDRNRATPLHFASWCGRPEIVRVLLGHTTVTNARGLKGCGADVNALAEDNWTPLLYASYFGKLEVIRLLLDHGANVDAPDKLGNTPLHYVSLGNYDSEEARVGIAQLLLKHGGDVDGQTKKQQTPLHAASLKGKQEIAQLLLGHGAKANAVDDVGGAPLHYVSGVGVARLLLEHGGDVHGQNKQQQTPLHAASLKGKQEIAQLLLGHGAKVNAVDEVGGTPLHYVSGVDVALLLLEHGGDVHGQNKQQQTPLHAASYNGTLGTARLLLDHGAKVDVVDSFGRTPLHDVSRGKYDSEGDGVGVARLLWEHGADVNAVTRSGETPLDLVSDSRPNLVLFLRRHSARPRAI